MFIVHGYPLQHVLLWISLLGYQCGYPHLYGLLKIDIQKSCISMLISVDFWKSMYGYAGLSDQGVEAAFSSTRFTEQTGLYYTVQKVSGKIFSFQILREKQVLFQILECQLVDVARALSFTRQGQEAVWKSSRLCCHSKSLSFVSKITIIKRSNAFLKLSVMWVPQLPKEREWELPQRDANLLE